MGGPDQELATTTTEAYDCFFSPAMFYDDYSIDALKDCDTLPPVRYSDAADTTPTAMGKLFSSMPNTSAGGSRDGEIKGFTPEAAHDYEIVSSSIARETRAVFFGWISHPDIKKWREMVKVYSDNTSDFPRWEDKICDEIRQLLKGEGVDKFYHYNKDGTGRQATDGEFLQRTKKRFLDDRKPSAQSKSTTPSQRRGRPPNLITSHNKKAKLSARQPMYAIVEAYVCLEWMRHPGTIKWLATLEAFSGNKQLYPEWKDDIAELVKKNLADEHIFGYLVFRDPDDKRCLSIHDGLWVHASPDEIVEITKQQFLSNRQQLKQAPTNGQTQGATGQPPDGDGPSPGYPDDNARHPGDFSLRSSHANNDGSFPNPHGGQFNSGSASQGMQMRAMNVDSDCSDLTLSVEDTDEECDEWDDEDSSDATTGDDADKEGDEVDEDVYGSSESDYSR